MNENKTETVAKPGVDVSNSKQAPALDLSLLGVCPDTESNRAVLKQQWEVKYKSKISLSDYLKARLGMSK